MLMSSTTFSTTATKSNIFQIGPFLISSVYTIYDGHDFLGVFSSHSFPSDYCIISTLFPPLSRRSPMDFIFPSLALHHMLSRVGISLPSSRDVSLSRTELCTIL